MFSIERKDLGPNFLFGTATAAYQIEGGQAKEGLGAADDIIARKLLVERSGGRTGGRGKGIAAGFMVGISNR